MREISKIMGSLLHKMLNCLKLDRVKRFVMFFNKFGRRYIELKQEVFPGADNDPVKELLRKWKREQIDLFEKGLPRISRPYQLASHSSMSGDHLNA